MYVLYMNCNIVIAMFIFREGSMKLLMILKIIGGKWEMNMGEFVKCRYFDDDDVQ